MNCFLHRPITVPLTEFLCIELYEVAIGPDLQAMLVEMAESHKSLADCNAYVVANEESKTSGPIEND